MVNTNSPEVIEFQQFISEQIRTSEPPISPEDCLSRFRALYPSSGEIAESIACIEEALVQREKGEGKSLKEFDSDFRGRNSL